MAACSGGAGGDVDGAPVDDAAAGPGLTGQLLGPDGTPVPDMDVLACEATTCAFGESQAQGRFTFTLEPGAQVAVKTHAELARSPRWAAALEPVVIDDTLVDVGTVYIPDLPDGSLIGPDTEDPQTLAAGDGLELTLNRADLTPPIGEILYDVAARLVPTEHVPPYLELDGEQVVAVYAMHPFAATSSSPIGVRAPVALPDGTALAFRTISELDGRFSPPVAGQAEGGFATTEPGAGITRFTYLVITQQ